MTAVPHDGISTRRLRESAGAIRSRVGSRIVRPGAARKSTPPPRASAADSMGTAQSVGGTAAIPSSPLGINIGALNPGTGVGSLRLVLAGRRVRLGNGAFLLLVLGLLSATLVSLLVLNTALAENSFQLQDIRQNARDLTVREQVLSGQLALAESPIGLEKRAGELGMVAAGSPVFLRLSDGKVLGESSPAEAPAPPAKPKKPKVPVAPGPYAGEFPVGTGTMIGETPVGSGAGSGGGEVPVGSGPTAGFPSETGAGAPVGGELPVGIVQGATR